MQQSTGSKSSPIFYQYVTLFHMLVVSKHPVYIINIKEKKIHMRRRLHALCYVAGYIIMPSSKK